MAITPGGGRRSRPEPPKTGVWTLFSDALLSTGGRYGAPRITLDLQAEGWRVSRRRVAKRMRALGLRVRATRRFKATTHSKHRLPVAPNRLQQDLTVADPNQTWVADNSVPQQAA